MKPIRKISADGVTVVWVPPSLATDIDIAGLVTSDGCRASDPLSLSAPRLSHSLAISRQAGPRLSRPRSLGPASPECQPGPRTIQITDPGL